MDVKLDPIEFKAAPGGAIVCVRGFVPLPLGLCQLPKSRLKSFESRYLK